MKNLYLYVIIPGILFLAFVLTPGVGYVSAQKDMAAKEETRQAAVKAKQDAEDARRRAIEAKAAEDAKQRQLEREQKEREKADKKARDYSDAIQKLNDDIALYSGEADKLALDASNLELQLNTLRNNKEAANRAAFDLSKQVEFAKVNRRNAELEIQRMVDIVAQRLNASPLSAPPPPPPAAPAK